MFRTKVEFSGLADRVDLHPVDLWIWNLLKVPDLRVVNSQMGGNFVTFLFSSICTETL